MAIDANIAMGVKPMRMDNPMDSYGKALTLQQLMGQAQETQQARQDKLTLNDLYRSSIGTDGQIDRAAMLTGAAQRGMGAQIPGMQKQWIEQDKSAGEIAKNTAQSGKLKAETMNLHLQQSRDMLGAVNDPQGAAAWLSAQYQNPDLAPLVKMSGKTLEQQLSTIPQDPQGFAKWKMQSSLGAEKLIQMTTPDANAQLSAATSTANNAASNATSRANNAASVGASYANAGATRAIASATRDAANIQRDQSTEMKLADDWRAQSKDFKEVGNAYKQITATLDKATTSPAATLAAATKFMKLLDPGSVVRESELGMALAATGVFDRATNYVNTLKYGKVLTANQAADFKNITAQIYGAAQAGQKQVDAAYTKQATAYKLRPEMVVQDLGQNTAPAKPSAGSKVVNFGDLK